MYYTRLLMKKKWKFLNISKFILMMCYDSNNVRNGEARKTLEAWVMGNRGRKNE